MRLLVSRGGSGVCRLLSAWSSRWACSITQLSTFGTCSALDASNSKAFAKPQPCGWIDALCCESSENFSCAGAAIANDDAIVEFKVRARTCTTMRTHGRWLSIKQMSVSCI